MTRFCECAAATLVAQSPHPDPSQEGEQQAPPPLRKLDAPPPPPPSADPAPPQPVVPQEAEIKPRSPGFFASLFGRGQQADEPQPSNDAAPVAVKLESAAKAVEKGAQKVTAPVKAAAADAKSDGAAAARRLAEQAPSQFADAVKAVAKQADVAVKSAEKAAAAMEKAAAAPAPQHSAADNKAEARAWIEAWRTKQKVKVNA